MFRAATHASLMAVSLLWMAGCDAEVPDVTASVYVPQTIATTTSMAMVPPSDEGRDAAHRHDAPPGDGASGADLPADHPRGPMDGSAAASDEGPDAPGVDHGQTPDSPPPGPTPYAVGPIHSPITATVGDHLRAIAATAPSLNDDLFMKIGASGTVSPNFLSCFSGSNIDWALAASGLADTQAHFLGGDAAGGDPFSRQTLAAKIGMSAGWAISGEPSPIEAEFDALDGPRFALVAYGTNDMHLGTSYQSALWGFGSKLQLLVDTLVSWGVIPILQTNGARLDLPEADRFVETYNTVIRAVAQSRQIPLMDMWAAMSEVPGWGKSGDGLHLNTYPGGACIFDEEGLDYGYNTRNLVTLHGLHRAKLAVVDEEPALNPPPPRDQRRRVAGCPLCRRRHPVRRQLRHKRLGLVRARRVYRLRQHQRPVGARGLLYVDPDDRHTATFHAP